MAPARATDLDLPDRCRSCAALFAGVHRARVRYASSVKLGPFIYTTIVFTALIDWAIWHRSPTLFVVLGMALVIGGGLVAIRGKTDAPLAAIES